MISTIVLVLKKFQKPIKFCLVGGTGMGLQLGILALLTEVGHVWYILSAAIAILIVAIWNYTMHNYWTFGNKRLL